MALTETLKFRLSAADRKKLKKLAKLSQQTVAAALRALIRQAKK